MAIYTSRFSNPELRKGSYLTVRIALGQPRWNLGYRIDGECGDLMPFGLLGKYDDDMAAFKREYFSRLNKIGAEKIREQMRKFESAGKDVVLLCYEDVRKGENDWCHRIMFAEWWKQRTGEDIAELFDPAPVSAKAYKSPSKPVADKTTPSPQNEQLSLSF